MSEKIKWRVRYENRPPFDNVQGEPWEAPALGVQFITQSDSESGRYQQTGDDYYVWYDSRWWGRDLFGLWDYLFEMRTPHPKACLAGRTIRNEVYMRLAQEAEEDPDFPPRSAVHPLEK